MRFLDVQWLHGRWSQTQRTVHHTPAFSFQFVGKKQMLSAHDIVINLRSNIVKVNCEVGKFLEFLNAGSLYIVVICESRKRNFHRNV